MKKVRVKLSDLFRVKGTENGQDSAKQEDAPTDKGKTEDGEAGGEDGEASGETETTPTDKGKTDKAEGAEETQTETGAEATVQVVEMTASEFQTMKSDAAQYQSVKAELETLRTWKASMAGLGGGLGKEDQTNRTGKKGASIMDTPWNQAAIAVAEKGK